MFDVTKSKLYSQIMSACASFFGLGADATESEIHEAVEGKDALAVQLEAARTEAVAAQSAQLTTITAQLETMQTELTALRTDMDAKDARIAELQIEATTVSAAMEAAQTQHKKEIATLAGQVSALKLGKTADEDEGGDTHEAGKTKPVIEGQVAISNTSLQALVKNARNN